MAGGVKPPAIFKKGVIKMLRDDAIKEGKLKPKDREEAVRLGLIQPEKEKEDKKKDKK